MQGAAVLCISGGSELDAELAVLVLRMAVCDKVEVLGCPFTPSTTDMAAGLLLG